MSEKVSNRNKLLAAIATASGAIVLASCAQIGSPSIERGVGIVPIDCPAPRGAFGTDELRVSTVPKGTSIPVGRDLVSDGLITGSATVISRGSGNFYVEVNPINNQPLASVAQASPNRATINDFDTKYTVDGFPGPNDSTGLSITAQCIDPKSHS